MQLLQLLKLVVAVTRHHRNEPVIAECKTHQHIAVVMWKQTASCDSAVVHRTQLGQNAQRCPWLSKWRDGQGKKNGGLVFVYYYERSHAFTEARQVLDDIYRCLRPVVRTLWSFWMFLSVSKIREKRLRSPSDWFVLLYLAYDIPEHQILPPTPFSKKHTWVIG